MTDIHPDDIAADWRSTPMDERFWAKVEVRQPDDCWPWTGGLDRGGYGRLRTPTRRGKHIPAHRYSAMLHFGMFDRRLHVLHRCDNPVCVNPAHLWLGTHVENTLDMNAKGRHWNAAKTECKRGHPFDAENTYVRRNGHRQCLACADLRRSRNGEGE